MTNKLFFGDNLEVLRDQIADESVDLIYLDPPFNSAATYNRLFRDPAGGYSKSQVRTFEDTWHWGDLAEREFAELVGGSNTDIADMVQALRKFLGENDVMAYLTMMASRFVELRRVLKPTGSLYLHCDPTASHYLKVVLDGVFGPENFRNEIVWKRTNARGTDGRWPRVHDVLFLYSASSTFTFNPLKVKADKAKLPHTLITGADGKKYQTYELTAPGATKDGESGKPWRGFDPNRYGRHWANGHGQMDKWDKAGLIHWAKDGFPRRRAEEPFDPESRTVTVGDVWTDIDRINQAAAERLGYPTQKPLSLLERVIRASSEEGDIVLDPFCGCGTAVHAAQKLKRQWIGIDVTHLAISLIEKRLRDAFPALKFEVRGTPKDIEGAKDLASRDRYEFQYWACSLVNAQPYQQKKKGADTGIDGVRHFVDESKQWKRVLVSVKSGHVTASMVRDLRGVMEREKAEIALFVTLEPPTKPMEQEALKAGFYTVGATRYRRIQILTVDALLDGKTHPQHPGVAFDANSFAKPSGAKAPDRQGELFTEPGARTGEVVELSAKEQLRGTRIGPRRAPTRSVKKPARKSA